MYWVMSLVGALVVGGLLAYLVATVFGRGEELPDVHSGEAKQQHWQQLWHAASDSEGIANVQFSQSLRGYTAAEVDAFLTRVAARMRHLEERLGEAAVSPRGDGLDSSDADEYPADVETGAVVSDVTAHGVTGTPHFDNEENVR